MLLKGKQSDVSKKDMGNGKKFKKDVEKDGPQDPSPLPGQGHQKKEDFMHLGPQRQQEDGREGGFAGPAVRQDCLRKVQEEFPKKTTLTS